MKFTLLTLIASMCLLGSTTANILKDIKNEFKDIEKTGIKNWIEEMFDETYGLLKIALNDLEGVQCLVNDALAIDKAALNVVPQLEACGIPMPDNLTPIITGAKELSNIVEDIVDLRKNFCIGDKGRSPASCIPNLLSTVFKLHGQSKSVNASIKNVLSTGEAAADCYAKALKNLEHEVTNFPAEIKVCAKSLISP